MTRFPFFRVLPISGAALALLVGLGASSPVFAVDAKTVPWVANNPLVPHDTWSGKSIRLKGTADMQGATIQYEWDFGDGSAPATGTVANQYVIEASHVYTGSPGDLFTARLTVTDTATGASDSASYFVQIQAPPPNLPVEVNVAIDEGLWYLHKTMNRFDTRGDWLQGTSCGSRCASTGYYAGTAANVNAFLANGHAETGDASNPYTETVQRAMRRVFEMLRTLSIFNETYPDGTAGPPDGSLDVVIPDSNGNGLGVEVANTDPPYQGGMFMDAIVATRTPGATASTGPAGIVGRSYADIVQDMVDAYAYGQGEAGTYYGGWRYSWDYGCGNCNSDNSTNQWAAIGMIAAEREWGLTVPDWVKTANINSINRTQNASGYFGYTNSNSSTAWGRYAVTPSGMVQMAMDGIGRVDPRWDLSENYMRNTFCNTGGPGNAVRDYYYGLFSFTKSMLLHDSDAIGTPGHGAAESIDFLRNQPGGANPLDWYNAEAAASDPCDGVARTLVNDQHTSGYWYNHNYDSRQRPFETAWAIIMLNRTVFDPVPVAVVDAVPNPALAGDTINLDGTASFHQNPDRSIVQYEWDFNNDGIYDAVGPIVSHVFPVAAPPPPPDVTFPVILRVTDDDTPPKTDTATIDVVITVPPAAPTANARGPYAFCLGSEPWTLDGTGSVNPDEGISELGAPGDTIQEYAWELDGNNTFDDALGPTPDVTAYFSGQGIGDYLVQLRVTDTTSTSYPTSGEPDLSDTDIAEVRVRPGDDPLCVGDDADQDGVPNESDLCPGTPAGTLVDNTGCNVDQAILCDADWRNARQYHRAVLRWARRMLRTGWFTTEERDQIMDDAVASDCGT